MTNNKYHYVRVSDVKARPVAAVSESVELMEGELHQGLVRFSPEFNAMAVEFRARVNDYRPFEPGGTVTAARVQVNIRVSDVDDDGDALNVLAEKEVLLPAPHACVDLTLGCFVAMPEGAFRPNHAFRVQVVPPGHPDFLEGPSCDVYLLEDELETGEIFKVERAGFKGIFKDDPLERALVAAEVESESSEFSEFSEYSDFSEHSEGRMAAFEAVAVWGDGFHDPSGVLVFHYPNGERRAVNARVEMDYSSGRGPARALFSAHDPLPEAPCGPVYVELRIMDEAVAGFVGEKLAAGSAAVEGAFSGEELRPLVGYTVQKGLKRLSEQASPLIAGGASAIESLRGMVGLEEVKAKVASYVELMQFHRLRADKGISSKMPPLHSLFLGAPGTGKTTVAELMGRLMKEAGVLSKGHVVVRERAQIVGKHYGDETTAMRKALEEAEGGVLFIDEAYTLYRDSDPKDPGRDAIESLLTALADPRRRNWMLILGGYEDRILRMFEMNPGLASRFPLNNRYRFADYSAEDLLAIAEGYCRENAYELSAEAAEKLLAMLREDVRDKDATFGNARHVLNLLETEVLPAMAARVARLAAPEEEDLKLIRAADIPERTRTQKPRPRMGFRA